MKSRWKEIKDEKVAYDKKGKNQKIKNDRWWKEDKRWK